MCEIWNRKFLDLAGVYRDELNASSDFEKYMETLANSPIRISILCESYGVMVKLKMIEPLENLDEKEKLNLWNEAKRLSQNQDRKHLHQPVKTIYSLAQFVRL